MCRNKTLGVGLGQGGLTWCWKDEIQSTGEGITVARRDNTHRMGIHMGLVDSEGSKCCSLLQFLLLMYQSCPFIKLFLVNSGVSHLRFDCFFFLAQPLRDLVSSAVKCNEN